MAAQHNLYSLTTIMAAIDAVSLVSFRDVEPLV